MVGGLVGGGRIVVALSPFWSTRATLVKLWLQRTGLGGLTRRRSRHNYSLEQTARVANEGAAAQLNCYMDVPNRKGKNSADHGNRA